MVGDLSYQLLCQGREGYASFWCAFCMFGKSDWEKTGAAKIGPAWTLENMQDMLVKVQSSTKKLKSHEKKGLTNKQPIFDAIKLENYITPPLHAVDLFINSIKDLFDAYVDHRLEDCPQETLEARWEEADRKEDERKHFQDLKETELLLTASRELGDANLVAEAEAALKQITAEYKKAKELFGKAAASARKLEKTKQYGALSQTLRQQIDGLLAELFNILRSAYHGGDMEGNYCRKLMRLAEEAMDQVENLLLTVPQMQRAPGCSNDEINKYCRAFKRMFQYMDVLSHSCYQPFGTITDSELVNINALVVKMDRLWRKLSKNTPPKVHAWQHLASDLDRFRGLKYHNESKIEVSHQIGRQTELRFRSMAGSVEKKIKAASKFQANLQDPAMKARQQEINIKRSRNFGTKAKAAKQTKNAETKRAKLNHLQSIILLPEITDSFPSMLELLTVIDRKNRQSE